MESGAPPYQSAQARRICSSFSRVLSFVTALTLSAASRSIRSSAARLTSSTTKAAVVASAEARASAVEGAQTPTFLSSAALTLSAEPPHSV